MFPIPTSNNGELMQNNPAIASSGVHENKKLLIFCTESRGFLVSETNEDKAPYLSLFRDLA